MEIEKLPFEPPEPDYVAEQYIIKIPITDKHFKSPWELRKYAAKLVEKELGDNVQMTDLKVKKPKIISRLLAKILKRTPQAKLYATIKF